MRGEHIIRSDHSSDIRDRRRPGYDLIQKEAFAITRELTPRSAKTVGAAIVKALIPVNKKLSLHPSHSARAKPQDGVHLTYLSRSDTVRAMEDEIIDLSDSSMIRETLEKRKFTDIIRVPVEEFDWLGSKQNKLVTLVTDDKLVKKLDNQTAELADVFSEFDAEVALSPPTHLTLVRYQAPRSANNVAYRHRRMIGEVVRDTFMEEGVTYLELGFPIVETRDEIDAKEKMMARAA
ncbi:MAG: hypothetical protein QFB86_04490 [Patescibacteria group bacterium]|nr:hypothetical protein [Patescibacteria group bacterium]